MTSRKPQVEAGAGSNDPTGIFGPDSTAHGDEKTRELLAGLLPRLRDEAGAREVPQTPDYEFIQRIVNIPQSVADVPPEGRRILGQYELLECIGRGGMGEVFRARHLKLGQIVAVKVVRPDLAWDQAARQRFEQEMRAIGRLGTDEGSEYVVRPLHADEQAGVSYLVMEFITGSSLNDVIESALAAGKQLTISECCNYIRQAALGLDFAHRHGIVHRDIKPSNLLVDSRGRVRILDLGLARIVQEAPGVDSAAEITHSGQIMGTPDFMSPEQLRDSRESDARTDVYALGATLYKLLTGRAPFAGDKFRTLESKLLAIADGVPPSVLETRSDIPPQLAAVVHRMMARNPAERFGSAGEVAKALAAFVDGEEPSTPSPQPAVASQRPRRSWRIASGLGAAAFLLAGIVIRLGLPQEGEFVVTSDENVQLTVRRIAGESNPQTFAVRTGSKRHKLSLGKYAVEIEGADGDEFRITPQQIEIVRGKSPIVTVERVPLAPPVTEIPVVDLDRVYRWQDLVAPDIQPGGVLDSAALTKPATLNSNRLAVDQRFVLRAKLESTEPSWSLRCGLRDRESQQAGLELRISKWPDDPVLLAQLISIDNRGLLKVLADKRLAGEATEHFTIDWRTVGHQTRVTVNQRFALTSPTAANRERSPYLQSAAARLRIDAWQGRGALDDGQDSPDRQAAEWVLALGGSVGAVDQQTYTKLDQLPTHFQIGFLELSKCPLDVNSGLHLLTKIETLGALSLSFTNLSDEGMQHVGRIQELGRLDIQNTLITGAGLKALARHPKLLTLWLNDTRIANDDLVVLETLPQLEQLSLPPDAADAILPTLLKLKNLRSLNLSGTKVSAAGKEAWSHRDMQVNE